MIAPASADPAAELPIIVTYFAEVNAPGQWTDEQTTWGAWAVKQEITPYTAKEAAPLHALYRLRRGGKRCNADVETVYGVCLDFDGVPGEHVLECARKLQADGVALLWHSTYKHGRPLHGANKKDRAVIDRWGITEDERRRIIIPLASPIPASQYDDLLGVIWGKYAEHADKESGGVHRAFYVPSCAPGREGSSELYYLPGKGYQYEPYRPPLAPVPDAPVISISSSVWQRLASRWARSSSARNIDLSERLKRVLEGVPYAEHGERDTVTWQLVQAIVHAYPDASDDSVAHLFRLSVGAMQAQGSSLTEAEILEKLARARRAKLAAEDTSLPEERREAIRQAFGTSRCTPYDSDELTEIETALGLTREELSHAWILHHGGEYWLVGREGRLHLATRDSLENTARVVLAPAPIDLHEIHPANGVQWMGRRSLLERYSLPVERVAKSMAIASPKLDLQDRTLTIPVCPIRPIVPKFDENIDRWLRLLAGDRYVQLCAWLQWVPELAKPLAALVLTGDPSIGKTLLARGLSRLWTTTEGPTELELAMGTYNQKLEDCPYCLADEGRIPRDWRGRERTEDLREFIQCTTRTANQKYRQMIPLEGAARVQIAANNLNVLTMRSDLSAQDVDAIALRFLHIPGRIEAAEFLAKRGGREGATPWVEGDGLAAHTLYLHQLQLYPWEGRFGVPSQPDLVNKMLVRGGVRGALCEIFVAALKDPTPLREGAVSVRGQIACRLDWIPDAWDLYLRRPNKPESSQLIQALDGLAERIEVDGEGWFVVETCRLVAWAKEAGVGNAEKVHKWLLQHEGRT